MINAVARPFTRLTFIKPAKLLAAPKKRTPAGCPGEGRLWGGGSPMGSKKKTCFDGVAGVRKSLSILPAVVPNNTGQVVRSVAHASLVKT